MGCGNSLFGASSQFIKVNGSDFVAVDGANQFEKLLMGDLRMPYKQLLKSRVILKAGQQNYLMNFLGLGDNATFLAIKATYDSKSVIEEDNYINWSFFDDMGRINKMAQLLVLTGNSTNRINQLYLSNDNLKYNVSLEIMTGVIDDNYSFFSDVVNQTGRSFVNIRYTDIKTHIVGESIAIYDRSLPPKPLVYMILVNIQSIERVGSILTILDSSAGPIFIQFIDEFNAIQAHSLINYILENPSIDIDDINPIEDIIPPVLYFKTLFDGNYISYNGATSGVPYNTTSGFTFSTSGTLSNFGGSITKAMLVDNIVENITDNRDGVISITSSNITIKDINNTEWNSILTAGTYSIYFDIKDIAQNNLNNVNLNIVIN